MALALVSSAAATDPAFFAIFGLFVVGMVVLAVIVVLWAVRHDIAGRKAWQQRQEAQEQRQPPRAAP